MAKSKGDKRWSAHEALADVERRLAASEAAREKAQAEVLRLRGVIDAHEVEAEKRHQLRADEEIADAKHETEELRSRIRDYVDAFKALKAKA